MKLFTNCHSWPHFAVITLILGASLIAGCAEREMVLITLDPSQRDVPCADGGCDGVGNINGVVDWIEPRDVTDEGLLNAAKASGMITISGGGETSRCSATLIGPDLLITNHHCVPDQESAGRVSFIPETERERSPYRRFSRRFSCPELVATSCAYDVSILRCRGDRRTGARAGDLYGYVELSLRGAYRGDDINLIHTNCDYRDEVGDASCLPVKLISPGLVTSYGPRCLRIDGAEGCEHCKSSVAHATHTADSLGGSSGGGVFDATTHKLIGLNWGGVVTENQTDGVNYLTTLRDLVEDEPAFAAVLTPLIESRPAPEPEPTPLPEPELTSEPTCAVISAYVEGQGYDKAITISPCPMIELSAGQVGLCLEANRTQLNEGQICERVTMMQGSATRLSSSDPLASPLWSICHPQISGGLRGLCQQFDDRAINFNGDDRVILFQDLNGDGDFVMGQDLILDRIGRLGQAPGDKPWADLVLLRRDFAPRAARGSGERERDEGRDELGDAHFEVRGLDEAREAFRDHLAE